MSITIENYENIGPADAVLACVRTIIAGREDIDARLKLGTYSNGREDGYMLFRYDSDDLSTPRGIVAFSEYRNSDNIVVYPAQAAWGDETHLTFTARNTITDEAYEAKRFFGYNKPFEAAEFIVEHLVPEVNS